MKRLRLGSKNSLYSSPGEAGTHPHISRTMAHEFPDEDPDKSVRTAEDERIGTVFEVSGDLAHVESDEGLTGAIRKKLG